MTYAYLSHVFAFRLETFWCYVFAGSGIYAPDGPRAYYYDTEMDNGHLLVTELSSRPRLSPDYPAAVNWTLYASQIKQLPSNKHSFSGVVYHDLFSFTELTESEGNRAICQQDLCCHLSYKMVEKQQDEIYVLGAFDGLHVVEGEYYLQVRVFCSYLNSGKAAIFSLQSVCICFIFYLGHLRQGIF